jgi:hypothetical protein
MDCFSFYDLEVNLVNRKNQVNRAVYEQLFIAFSVKVEKVLIRMMLVFLALLLCSQALLQSPFMREHLTRVEPLEGKPYSSLKMKFSRMDGDQLELKNSMDTHDIRRRPSFASHTLMWYNF